MRKLFLILTAFYTLVVLIFWAFQEAWLFRDKPLPPDFSFSFEDTFEERWYETSCGVRLNAVYFHSRLQARKGVILYCHGNADNLARWGKYAPDFTKIGYDVLMFDYRHFGKSTGKIPTETELISDAKCVYDALIREVPRDSIILYGRSLGSGIAAQLALYSPPKALLLETPYTAIPEIPKRYFPFVPYRTLGRYQLDTEAIIQKIICLIHIFHGTKDVIVPYAHGQRLAEKLGRPDVLTTIEGGGHKNLRDYPEYHADLAKFLNAQ